MAHKQLDPALYSRVFEGQAEAGEVLADLVGRFYDVNVYVRGGTEGQRETERRAARREVIQYVLYRIGQVREPPPQDDQTTIDSAA